jgi:hypothetical protein
MDGWRRAAAVVLRPSDRSIPLPPARAADMDDGHLQQDRQRDGGAWPRDGSACRA